MPLYSENTGQKVYDNKKYFDENIRALTKREVSWLQSYFASKVNISFMSMGSTNLYEELINKLAETDNFKQVLHAARLKMFYSLVPNKHFEWFQDSFRTQIFILNFLNSEYNYNVKSYNSNNIVKIIYNFFDRKENEFTVENKIILLNNIFFNNFFLLILISSMQSLPFTSVCVALILHMNLLTKF